MSNRTGPDGIRPDHVRHQPIMLAEVLECLRPAAGEIALDCTLGGGAHTEAILERILPGGRLIGLDIDPIELPRTEARLRALGFGPDVLVTRHANFEHVAGACQAVGVLAVDLVLVDLGLSAMQSDRPDRGFSYKGAGPLDMRMDPSIGESASAFLARTGERDLARLLVDHADEPHAAVIARALKEGPLTTTQAMERRVRIGLTSARPDLGKAAVKASVRRTFQAVRIAVNDELSALEALLQALPGLLAPGGRAAIITFHSGEDRRVKKALQAGHRAGIYARIADRVIRPSMAETRANRRALSAKLRWAVRA